MKTIWIAGSKGQLGRELARLEGMNGLTGFIQTDINELDLTIKEEVFRFARKEKPSWIINCAGFTAVDKAEEQPEAAYALNRDIPANLAEAANTAGGRLIHISTDYVFDGTASQPYRETDTPFPLSVYAKSKAAGETEVQKFSQNLVIRTSWLYSAFGNNFVKTMLRLGQERKEIGVVADQFGSPTWGRNLAEAILTVISAYNQSGSKTGGIYHYADEGSCSWFEFASEIMALAHTGCVVRPLRTDQYPLPARRPAYSVLDKEKIKNDFGLSIPAWQKSLELCLRELSGQN